MINIFEEITWPQFSKMGHISKLSLQEQIKHYNQYIWELSLARDYYYQHQPKGPLKEVENFLLQENGFFLLQENGNKIFITDYA
jgi:hypothetical protein